MQQQTSSQVLFEELISKERNKLLSVLIKQLNDFELAEDALQEALIKGWSIWQHQGLPDHPQSWLLKTAYNQAIDAIRRQNNFNSKQPQISQLQQLIQEINTEENDEFIEDERLRLIYTCCHPILDQATQVALTLNTVCGFSTKQVAQSFLLKLPALSQRLVRAKRKIKDTGSVLNSPDKADLIHRLESVLSVIYLIHNQGYYATDNASLIDNKLCYEAIYLATTLNELLPDQAELLGLLSLMNFQLARFVARSQNPKKVISLSKQNRKLWNQDLIQVAQQWFYQATSLKSMGPYQIQAAISGVHCQAKCFDDTDWQQIITLYEKLYQYLPSETVHINQAVALAYNKQADEAWVLFQNIDKTKLKGYLPYHLAQAHILKTLNQNSAARHSFSMAMALSKNPKERAYIYDQIELLNPLCNLNHEH